MKRTTDIHRGGRNRHFIVLDEGRTFPAQFGTEQVLWVSNKGKLHDALVRSSNDSLWIVKRRNWTDRLLIAASAYSLKHPKSEGFGDLLLLEPPAQSESLPPLHRFFRRVIGEVSTFKILSREQLAQVLISDQSPDRFIGGGVDEGSKTLTLARGDLRTLTVPLSFFRSAGPTKPDFRKFDLDDCGYAIRFGDYEASAHSVLYEVDPDYRRRINTQRKAQEAGFGASLRRLRLLREKSRSDFPGISPKTIARIERGETDKPHGMTLGAIAKILEVRPEEIESY